MTTTTALDSGLTCIDLNFQGEQGVIAAYLLEDHGERALVEIGPTSTLDTLLAALDSLNVDPASISTVLVTHIHLDHAGAAGTFIRRFSQAQLYVHEIGAPHMVDPEKLLSSARRIYGDRMDPLWGDFEPVPETNVHALVDGDTVRVGNRSIDVVYTPGHASHHVAYHDADRKAVFTGDVGGCRIQGTDYVRPPTPPPDLDLDAWHLSIDRIRALDPHVLLLTHFGPYMDIDQHLAQISPRLNDWDTFLQARLSEGHDRDQLVEDLTRHGDEEAQGVSADAALLRRLDLATPWYMSVDGFLRLFRKRRR